jgi:hypothetical protein
MGHSLMGVRRNAEAPGADDARQHGRWRADGTDGQRTDAEGRTTDTGGRSQSQALEAASAARMHSASAGKHALC